VDCHRPIGKGWRRASRFVRVDLGPRGEAKVPKHSSVVRSTLPPLRRSRKRSSGQRRQRIELYMNGGSSGVAVSGTLPREYDVTPALRTGANVIAVKVITRSIPAACGGLGCVSWMAEG